jgi:FdhE protein
MSGAAGVVAEAPWLRPPRDAVALFERRAARLSALAAGHAAGDWLAALAALCAAQARAVATVAPLEPRLGRARPLAYEEWTRVGAWQGALAPILQAMREVSLPEPARAALATLADAAGDALARRGRAILALSSQAGGDATTPFVAAALQAWFTAQAAAPSLADVARSDGHCPLCGFPPVAGTVQGDDRTRYLCCGLCAAEWRLPRIWCARCGATAGISYFEIEGAHDGIKAEACAGCGGYVKLVYREIAPFAEPLADDVATLALDLLLGEAGLSRAGVNLLVAA